MSSLIKKLTPFLRKPSLNHAKAEVRLQALTELDLTQPANQSSFLTWFAAEEASTLEAGLTLVSKTPAYQTCLAELALANPALNLALIKFAPKQSLALKCLKQLTAEEATWLDLAQTSKLAKIRQAAAEKLTSETALEELAKQALNDKGLQRFARQQLDAIKAKQAAEAAQQEALVDVLTQLKDLTRARDKQLFSAKLQHLMNKWQEVEKSATDEQLTHYQTLSQEAKHQEEQLAIAEAQEAAAEKQRQAKLAEEAKQAELAAEERQAQAEKQAQHQAAKQAKKAAQQAKAAQTKQEQKKLIKQLADKINQLEQLLAQGEVQAATKLNNKLAQDLASPAVMAELSPKQQQKYKQLTAKLLELNSWQGFAAGPKRQELLEQMQALAADTSMLLPVKAEKIQQLQTQWRNLGSAATNKEIWQAFKQAADIAFEPCKAWFKEQNQLQKYNQEQKQIICTELENLAVSQGHLELDEDALDKLLQEVHNEWHRFNPVNRAEGKQLAQRFQQAIQPLKDQLYTLRQVNIAAKQQLIAQAKALLEDENLNQAIEANKQLQSEWRTLGRAPGSLEPRLWKEFRAACDALFNKRSEENLAKLAASEEKYQLAQAELDLAAENLAANKIKQANQHLAASYSQGLTQKHLRLLSARQQEIKAAINLAKQQATQQSLAAEFYAQLEGFNLSNQQPEEALEKLVYLEVVTDQPSAEANQQLRLKQQIQLMNEGKASLTHQEKHQLLTSGIETLKNLGLGQQTEVYIQLKALVENYLAG